MTFLHSFARGVFIALGASTAAALVGYSEESAGLGALAVVIIGALREVESMLRGRHDLYDTSEDFIVTLFGGFLVSILVGCLTFPLSH